MGVLFPTGVIDLHSHVLPGIDDGPRGIEGSVALARVALESGTTTLLATPHVSPRYPNEAPEIISRVEQLRERLAAEGIALEVLTGAEIAITRLAEIPPSELQELGLGGGRWLLIEPPFTPVASGIDSIVRDLLGRGHRVLLAHPERCPAFHRDPAMLEALVDIGALTSITAGSLSGQFGKEARRFALQLLEAEMAHNVASDAHDHLRRPPTLGEALHLIESPSLGNWLTREVPAAILAGEEIPPRPATASRSRRLPWRRR